MDQERRNQIEARRLINKLLRNCRQTLAYLDGISALSEQRLRTQLRDAIAECDRFMNT